MSLHLSISPFRINTLNPWRCKELDTTDWLNNNNPPHLHLLQPKKEKEFWKSKLSFFTLNIFFSTIYRENWSILSKLLHRPQSGGALWARVFLNTCNSPVYSWAKAPKDTRQGASQVALVIKSPPAHAGDAVLIPGLGRSPGEGNGNPLQYSCLENPMDRGAWWATVHGITKSWTWLKWLSAHAYQVNHWYFSPSLPSLHIVLLYSFISLFFFLCKSPK